MLASRCVRQEHAINFFLSLAEDLAEQQKALVASKKATADEQVDGCKSPGHAPVLSEMLRLILAGEGLRDLICV